MLRHRPKLRVTVQSAALSTGAAVFLNTQTVSADPAQRAAQRLAAEGLVAKAVEEPRPAARADFLEAGEAYLALWHEAGAEECKTAGAVCSRNAEILFNAVTAFRAAGEVSSAWAVRAILLDPANHLDQTALAKTTRFDQGDEAMVIADYARAASALEDAAREDPKNERALQALQDATVLRLGLGDLPRATADALEVEKVYGAKAADKAALIDSAIALSLAAREEWKEVDRFIGEHAVVLRSAEPVRILHVDVARGEALVHLGRRKDADVVLHHVADMSQDSLQAAASKGHADEYERTRALAEALTATADAKLALADEQRDRAMGLVVKKGDRASANAKRDAIGRVEKDYLAIASISPVAPPKDTVSAAARVASMRSTFWAQAFLALGDSAAADDEQKALEANRNCVEVSAKLEWSDAGVKACDAWLTRHDPTHHHVVTELIPALREGVVGPDALIFVDANGAPWASQ